MAGSIPFGCGQCLPCRVNRARQWQWRQVLESLTHSENCFVTLTYNDECLPSDLSLDPAALRLFLKRLRRAIAPLRIRFFAVGEYGEQSTRPHYHLNLFGVSGFTLVPHRFVAVETIIASCWPHGFVQVGEFTTATASYLTGYVTKKLKDRATNALAGRFPEFARMSNRPGLGASAMLTVAKSLSTVAGTTFLDTSGDIPPVLKFGGRDVILPRYLISKLRQAVGFTDEYVAEIKSQKSMEKSLEMLSLHLNNPQALTIKETYLQEIEQKILNLEGRAKLYQQRRKL